MIMCIPSGSMDGMTPPAAVTYVTLATRLCALNPSCGPVRVVAVDGPSGAGKSTFAARLSAALGGAPAVHSDDFPVPWDGDPLAWWPPLTAQVLDPLRAGRPGRFRGYDWRRGVYAEDIEIPIMPVLIIEGVGAAKKGAPAAFRIWVEAPHGVRRRRAAERGDDLAVWDRWVEAEARHFAADRTRERADLIVDGTHPGSHW
jgi:uridine kinase